MSKIIDKENRKQEKKSIINAAFVAWQLGAGAKKTFGEYLTHLGIDVNDNDDDKEEWTEEKKKKELEKINKQHEKLFRKVKKFRRATK